MAKYTKAELGLIWLDSFTTIDYRHKKELYNQIKNKDSIKDVLENDREYVLKLVGDKEYDNLLNSANAKYLNYVTEGLDRRGITAITLESQSYPESLSVTPFAPLVLYTKGNIELLKSQCFSIVGSRKSLPVSIKITQDFAKSLSNAGFTLVTGIAEGVDQAVIETAIKNSGKVISVLGGGFDNIYPSANAKLVEQVINKGLVITEYTAEIKAKPFHFPIRNRIIAGLSKGTLVTSGAIKSGTQHTASYTVEYSRDLFAVPYSVGIASGAGCNYLIKNGAMLCDAPSDILSFYGLEEKQQPKVKLSELQVKIVKILSDGERHVQQICQTLDKPIFEILSDMSFLEMNGIISKNGTNVYGLIKNVLEE